MEAMGIIALPFFLIGLFFANFPIPAAIIFGCIIIAIGIAVAARILRG